MKKNELAKGWIAQPAVAGGEGVRVGGVVWVAYVFFSMPRQCLSWTKSVKWAISPDRHPSLSQNVSVRPVRRRGTMGWSQTWLDFMPSISSSSFQVGFSSFDPFKCIFWARTDKRTHTHTHTHTQGKTYSLHPRVAGCITNEFRQPVARLSRSSIKIGLNF